MFNRVNARKIQKIKLEYETCVSFRLKLESFILVAKSIASLSTTRREEFKICVIIIKINDIKVEVTAKDLVQ